MSTYNFPPTSRYYGLPVEVIAGAGGEPVSYLARRFLPPSSSLALLRLHLVTEGERPDTIAARELGAPDAFWRIADGNDVMRPDELVTAGRVVRITLPPGIPGVPTG